jgi:threonine/homoserine/homoserine lactone efflux protein
MNELLSGFGLGLVGGVIPGPILVYLFTQIVQKGYLKSVPDIFKALTAESIVALSTLLILSNLSLGMEFFYWLSIIGSVILIWIAWKVFGISSMGLEKSLNLNFWQIFLIVLCNGTLWIFWITVCIPKAILLGQQVAFGEYLYLISVELGWFVSTSLALIVLSRFKMLLAKPKVSWVFYKVIAALFIYFAVDMLADSVNGLV